MTERPILFSAPLVRAILDGRKTVTRRPVKSLHVGDLNVFAYDATRGLWEGGVYGDGGAVAHGEWVRCPYGQAGDRLWVRETWTAYTKQGETDECDEIECAPAEMPERYGTTIADVVYAADETSCPKRWRPGIHMPRWASRITLAVTSVGVERLQDITEEDARAEGVEAFQADPEGDCWTDGKHRTAFEHAWNSIYGWEPNAWAQNPWVWTISFNVVTNGV